LIAVRWRRCIRRRCIMIRWEETDPNFKYEIMREPGGENLLNCYQCSTCTLGCPVTEVGRELGFEYNPRKVIQMSILGLRSQVLSRPEIWFCASCQICREWCPQDVRFSEVMGAIHRIAEREAEKGKLEIRSRRPDFAHAFLNQVKKYGRQYEMGLMREFYKGRILQMMKDYRRLGMALFLKGKTALLPDKIRRREEIARIFEKIREHEEKIAAEAAAEGRQ